MMSIALPKRAAKAGSSRASTARASGASASKMRLPVARSVRGRSKPELRRQRPQVRHHHPPPGPEDDRVEQRDPGAAHEALPRRAGVPARQVAADEVAGGLDAADQLALEAHRVAGAHVLHDLRHLLLGHPERAQRLLPEREGREEGLADLPVHPGLGQPQRLLPVEGAGEHRHQRELGLAELDDPDRRLPVVDADDDHPRLARAGGVQDVEPRPVAVVDLEAEVGRRLDHLRVGLDHADLEAAREQRLADDLPDPAEADDERVAVQPVRRLQPLGARADARRAAGRAGSP